MKGLALPGGGNTRYLRWGVLALCTMVVATGTYVVLRGGLAGMRERANDSRGVRKRAYDFLDPYDRRSMSELAERIQAMFQNRRGRWAREMGQPFLDDLRNGEFSYLDPRDDHGPHFFLGRYWCYFPKRAKLCHAGYGDEYCWHSVNISLRVTHDAVEIVRVFHEHTRLGPGPPKSDSKPAGQNRP